MRPVSAAFLRTIRGSHKMVARARVCTSFQTGTNPDGTQVSILDGDVVLDGTADTRGTLDLLTDGNGTWAVRSDDLLVPCGNEFYVERGVQYSDDRVEYVGLGYYRIDTVEQETAPAGAIRITGSDRMAGIVDARLLAPVQFLTGATLGFIVATLVHEVYPDATIEWDDATDTDVITRSMICDEDRYRFIDDLITARAKIWSWDHRGVLVIESPPDPRDPVWEVMAGPGGVLVALSRTRTRIGAYNAVVALGEAADTADPVRGVAIDNNVNSPTYFYGRFGPVPRYFSSPFLGDPGQAAAAADSILRRQLGLPYSLTWEAVVNPALVPWDPVDVRASTGEGSETHVLSRITIPLVPDAAMTAETREQTVVLVGSL